MAKRRIESTAKQQPNILMIVLDTLRRDRLSLYGHDRETSPTLDAFAQNATVYERAISPAQWTVPAHASLFTGLYPGEHGVTQAYSRLSGLHPTLAEILQSAGYHTAAFCNNPLLGVLNHGLQRGFDDFYNYASVVPQRPDVVTPNRLRRALDRRLRPYARRMGNMFAQNDELFRLSLHPWFVPLWTRSIRFKGDTAMSVDDLIAYWNAHRAGTQNAPLFAFVNLMNAHLPYHPSRDALEQVAPGASKDKHAHAFVRRFNADAVRWESPDDPPLTDAERRAILDFYDAEIAAQDRQLGRLLAWLQASGTLDDNTYVVILADHGEGHGDHDLFGHAFVVHQELVHVPLIIYGPERFARGGRVRETVSTRRLFHTLLDLAGVEPPLDAADPNADVAGLSLAGQPNGGREHDTAFAEAVSPTTFLHALAHRNPAAIERMKLRLTRRSVYEGATKLTAVGDEPEALYDTASDPKETRDQRHLNPATTEALARRLAAFAAGERADSDEPVAAFPAAVEEQLRALGYIE